MSITTDASYPLATSFSIDAQKAFRLSIATYFTVGSLSVLIWDILFNVGRDYQLFKKHGGNLPLLVYSVSRFSALAFALMETFMLTRPVKNCGGVQAGILVAYNIFIATTLLLSFFRVSAAWNRSKIISGVFGFLWLVAVGMSLTTTTSLKAIRYPPSSPFCTEMVTAEYFSVAVFGPTFNHLVVFAAITYRLGRPSHPQERKLTLKGGYRVYVLGETLPVFSRTMLQTSQICYLVAMISGLAAITWFYVYSSDAGYRLAIFVPYSVTINIMFSWVFRTSKIRGSSGSTLPISIANYAQPQTIESIVMKRSHLGVVDVLERPESTYSRSSQDKIEVEIKQVVESVHDQLSASAYKTSHLSMS